MHHGADAVSPQRRAHAAEGQGQPVDWPEVDTAAVQNTLLDQMALTRQVTSLGLGARSTVNLKVRQPLAKALVHVRDGQETLSEAFTTIVADELNVKALAFVADEATLLRFEVLPNSKLLGPRFGGQFPQVRAALSALDPAAVVHQVQAGVEREEHHEDWRGHALPTSARVPLPDILTPGLFGVLAFVPLSKSTTRTHLPLRL
jgi:isoleucyl-tRNA synthetase